MKSSFEQNGGTYRQVGNFNIPNLTLSPEESNITLGKWGMLHKDYLINHKKVFFYTLLIQGELYQHCAEIEAQAKDMFNTLFEQMKVAEGVTEHLKEENQIEWIRCVQKIEEITIEYVNKEIIFT